MAVDVQRVVFDESADLRYEGTDYKFREGDEAVLRHNYARKVAYNWNLAHTVGEVYELVQDEYEEVKGKVESEEESYEYQELQGLAKEHDIPANQSADELREALADADVI